MVIDRAGALSFLRPRHSKEIDMQKQKNLASNGLVLEHNPAIRSTIRPAPKNKSGKTPIQTTEPNPYWVAFFTEALRLSQVARERREANTARQEQENAEGVSDVLDSARNGCG